MRRLPHFRVRQLLSSLLDLDLKSLPSCHRLTGDGDVKNVVGLLLGESERGIAERTHCGRPIGTGANDAVDLVHPLDRAGYHDHQIQTLPDGPAFRLRVDITCRHACSVLDRLRRNTA